MVAAAAMLAGVGGIAATTADAAPLAESLPMTAHGVTATTSDSAGVHVTLDDGVTITLSTQEYATWQSSITHPRTNTIQPNQTITGNCGSSTLTFVPIGNHQGKMGTGFVVNTPAVSYHWQVVFTDNFGVSAQNMFGGLAFRTTWTWNPPFTFTGGGGPTRAAVNPSESFALLETGSVCTSGGPSESAIIT